VNALDELNAKVDCVVVTVAHDEFKEMKMEDIKKFMNAKPVIIDARGILDGEKAEKEGFYYKRL
jgi:UDP-N-acetyl-D-mannosaminuronate dehydrogenase